MCGPIEKKPKAADATELTPSACGDKIQAALNTVDDVPVNVVARALRGLCRWLNRVYVCIDDRVTRVEERAVALHAWAWGKQGHDHYVKRVMKLEGWMNGEESGSRSHAKAVYDLSIMRAGKQLKRVEKIEARLEAHIRGDIVTPLGNLRGPGPLLHEMHPHPANSERLDFSEAEKEALVQGSKTLDEIIENREKAAKAFGSILESQVMKDVCPDIPMGLERKRPRFCSQCGAPV